MTITTKIVRQYQCCGQVMPVPVMIKKLACWRPPTPLYPPSYLPPYCPYQQQPQQQQQQLYPLQNYQPYPQPYPYPYPVNAMQQVQQVQQVQQMQQVQQVPQIQQQSQQINQIYAITAPNESIPPQHFQTQSTSSQNDSDPNYRLPPNYPIIEYSSELNVLPGNIVIQTTDAIPDGYLLCDGADVSRETEAKLFSVIGTFYGNGDGSTTFCLPDLEDEEQPQHHYMIKR